MVDLRAELHAPCPPAVLFEWVADLDRYPQWLTIVTRAERRPEPEPAWTVDLRGRLGPLARSKRLRMIRTELVPGHRAVFERHEGTARRHSPWRLRAEVEPVEGAPGASASASRLTMALHYGGTFWGAVLERLLADEIERSRARLLALVST